MKLSAELNQNIIAFFTSLPNMQDRNAWEALLNSASLDEQLQTQIDFSGPPGQFFQRLVPTLVRYGMLEDDRHALIAVLQAAQTNVGKDRKAACQALIDEVRRLNQNQQVPRQDLSIAAELKRLQAQQQELKHAIQALIGEVHRLNQNQHAPSIAAKLRRMQARERELEHAYQMVSENIQALNEDYHNTHDQSSKLLLKRKLDKQQAERQKLQEEIGEVERQLENLNIS